MLSLNKKEINEDSVDCEIKVRILLLWKQPFKRNQSTTPNLDMILVDEQGNKIHCSIHYSLVPNFAHLLEEGGFRIISNFEVKSTKSTFMLANHPCKLFFVKDTVVCASPAFESAGHSFQFCSFEHINDSTVDKNVSFDIIGQVIENKPIRVMGPKHDQRHIVECQVRDHKGTIVSCALWDDYAKQFHQYVSANNDLDEPVIIILQLAKFNTWNRKPQVSNCMFGAKLYINEDIEPITDFKESLKGKTFGTEAYEKYPKLSDKIIHIKPEDSYLKFPLKGIVELLGIKEPSTCVVVGKITRIITDQGWNYLACRKCNKKVVKLEKNDAEKNNKVYYSCESCTIVLDVYRKIKLQVMVEDKSGSRPLWIFENVVTKLVNRAASYLINKIKPGHTHHIYPDEFNTLLNKSYVFQVEITQFNLDAKYKIFTVFNLSDDTDVIKSVLAKPGTKENAINLDDESDEDEGFKINHSECQIRKRRNDSSSNESEKLKIPKLEKDDSTAESIIRGNNNQENEAAKLKVPKIGKDDSTAETKLDKPRTKRMKNKF